MNTPLPIKYPTGIIPMRRAFSAKAAYTNIFMYEILPVIQKISNQSRYGYHGISHTIQVGLFGIEIAIATKVSPIPVMLACGLHDCARTNDAYCEEHGPACVPIAEKMLNEKYSSLGRKTINKILSAVANHTTGRNAPDEISACLWDADRIRLSWELGYNPKFFSTEYGNMIASLSLHDQNKYIAHQDKFLITSGIYTRAQIEYNRCMDAIQSSIGTQFKTR